MTFGISPTVAVTERDLTLSVGAVPINEGAIAGDFGWGPMDSPQFITSENMLVDNFGKPTDTNFVDWFSAADFLGYSQSLWVNRVGNVNGANSVNPLNAVAIANTASLGANSKAPCANATATVTTATNSITITGSNTEFYTAFAVGDTAVIGNDLLTIATITNNTSMTVSSFPSVANASAVIYRAGVRYKNKEEYDAATGIADYGYFSAKYPGSIGNSLEISVCPSANAYTSNFTLTNSVRNGVNTEIATTTFATTFANLTDGVVIFNGQTKPIVAANATHVVVSGSFGTSANIATISTTGAVAWKYYNYFNTPPGTTAYASTKGASSDGIHVIIVDKTGNISGVSGKILEKYEGLSVASDAKKEDGTTNYYKDVLNNQSKYVYWLKHPVENSTNWGTVATSGKTYGAAANKALTLSFYGGRDSTPGVDDKIRGYDVFKNKTDYEDIMYMITTPVSDGTTTNQLTQYMIDNISNVRMDCYSVFSPEMSDVVNVNDNSQPIKVIDFANNTSTGVNRSSSYGVMDCNWKYRIDKYNDKYCWTPCNADVAGLMASVDNPWDSPAKELNGTIKNVIKLAWNPDEPQRDQLYKNGINPICSFKDTGPILYGDKTFYHVNSAFDRINVRSLFIYLEKSIAKMARRFLFMNNTEFTRYRFKNVVDPFLRYAQGKGGIIDYRVICDNTNNTAEVIDRNEFVGSIFIVPPRSINYIQLDFVACKTNVRFDEIIGKV